MVHTRRAAIGATASDTTASTTSETRTMSGARVIRSGFVTHAGRQRRSRKGSRNRWRARIAATDAQAIARNTADRERKPSAATTVTGSRAAREKPSTTSRGVSEWSSPGANSASSTGPTIGGAVRLTATATTDVTTTAVAHATIVRDAPSWIVARCSATRNEQHVKDPTSTDHAVHRPSADGTPRIIVVGTAPMRPCCLVRRGRIHVHAVSGCLRRPAGASSLPSLSARQGGAHVHSSQCVGGHVG